MENRLTVTYELIKEWAGENEQALNYLKAIVMMGHQGMIELSTAILGTIHLIPTLRGDKIEYFIGGICRENIAFCEKACSIIPNNVIAEVIEREDPTDARKVLMQCAIKSLLSSIIAGRNSEEPEEVQNVEEEKENFSLPE